MTSEGIMRPDLEATPTSKAIKMAATGNMHENSGVFEVADFLVKVK